MEKEEEKETFIESVYKLVFVILIGGLAASIVVWMIRWAWNYPL